MIYHGDLFDVLPTLDAESIDACVTDPPYELGFMGKAWDAKGVTNNVDTWRAVFRVLKPGAHLLAFGGTRTYHRMTCAIEDAGFEIRDCLQWLYGSGFPKSLDVSKAMDAVAGRVGHSTLEIKRCLQNGVSAKGLTLAEFNAACGFEASGYLRESSTWANVLPHFDKWVIVRDVLGLSPSLDDVFRQAEREVIGRNERPAGWFTSQDGHDITTSATDLAKQWQGWGTALKPACEPIVLARKPLIGTVAANVQRYGTGAINVDACRIGTTDDLSNHVTNSVATVGYEGGFTTVRTESSTLGRWPANVLLDEAAAAMLDQQSGELPATGRDSTMPTRSVGIFGFGESRAYNHYGDSGGASRFFYVAKPARSERDYGCEKNGHPTVKPLEVLRWLVRLVTPPDGLVLDPFMGSGSTGMACRLEQRRFVGIEREADYVTIARERIESTAPLFAEAEEAPRVIPSPQVAFDFQ